MAHARRDRAAHAGGPCRHHRTFRRGWSSAQLCRLECPEHRGHAPTRSHPDVGGLLDPGHRARARARGRRGVPDARGVRRHPRASGYRRLRHLGWALLVHGRKRQAPARFGELMPRGTCRSPSDGGVLRRGIPRLHQGLQREGGLHQPLRHPAEGGRLRRSDAGPEQSHLLRFDGQHDLPGDRSAGAHRLRSSSELRLVEPRVHRCGLLRPEEGTGRGQGVQEAERPASASRTPGGRGCDCAHPHGQSHLSRRGSRL